MLDYVNMPLEEYAKTAGSETQNYNELVSFNKITTLNGTVGYRTTWMVQPMTINGVPPTSKGSESLPITYFEVPNSKTYIVRASLNQQEYLPVYEKMLTTINVMAPINPTPTVSDDETLKYVIKKYLTIKRGKSAEDLTITVNKIDGLYAQGGASGEGGGGMWFASKEEGMWVLVWDGNGTIDCSTFSLYPNFSKKLIPECYDSEKQIIVTR